MYVLSELDPDEYFVPEDFFVGVLPDGYRVQTLLWFNASELAGTKIESANLYLFPNYYDYNFTSLEEQIVEIYKVAAAWENATWNTKPYIESKLIAEVAVSETSSDSADITELVQEWADNPADNFGIILKPKDEENISLKAFTLLSYVDVNYSIIEEPENECEENNGNCEDKCAETESELDYSCGLFSFRKCCGEKTEETSEQAESSVEFLVPDTVNLQNINLKVPIARIITNEDVKSPGLSISSGDYYYYVSHYFNFSDNTFYLDESKTPKITARYPKIIGKNTELMILFTISSLFGVNEDEIEFKIRNPLSNEFILNESSCLESTEIYKFNQDGGDKDNPSMYRVEPSLKCYISLGNTTKHIGDYQFSFKMADLKGREATSTGSFKVAEAQCRDLSSDELIENNSKILFVFLGQNITLSQLKDKAAEWTNELMEVTPFDSYKSNIKVAYSDFNISELCSADGDFGVDCDGLSLIALTDNCKPTVISIIASTDFRAYAFLPFNGLGFTFMPNSSFSEVLMHEYGHAFGGLNDEYCERSRQTEPSVYPNTFSTKEECKEHSKTHYGDKECVSTCEYSIEEDKKENKEKMGFRINYSWHSMMISHTGPFTLPNIARLKWVFECAYPNDCSSMPDICRKNVYGNCNSSESAPACRDAVCKPFDEEDSDEDGAAGNDDCNKNNYAYHKGLNIFKGETYENEKCDSEDYNCDSSIDDACPDYDANWIAYCKDLIKKCNGNKIEYYLFTNYSRCCPSCESLSNEPIFSYASDCVVEYGEGSICEEIFEDGEKIVWCTSPGSELGTIPQEDITNQNLTENV